MNPRNICYEDKPPLGLTPKNIWKAHRKLEIIDAMKRYIVNGKNVPIEWIEELNELMEESK